MNDGKAKRIAFDELPSTNDYAKSKLSDGRDLIVTAKRQSGGRGTKGRSFSSLKGGVYLSKLTFYKDFPARNAFQIMSRAAVAVCETLRCFGLAPKIKWANDIFVNDRKICGILIENTFSGGDISSSIVGIGLNVCNVLEKELEDIATTMEKESGKRYEVEEVIGVLLEKLSMSYTMEDYRRYLGYMGEKVILIFESQHIPATLLSVTDEGRLTVEIDGEYKEISAVEVSLRI